MKTFLDFQEDLTDRRAELLQKQKKQIKQSVKKGTKSRAAFEKHVADEQESRNKAQKKIREREKLKKEIKKEIADEEEG